MTLAMWNVKINTFIRSAEKTWNMFTFLPFDCLLSNADILGLLPLAFPLVFVVFGQDRVCVSAVLYLQYLAWFS